MTLFDPGPALPEPAPEPKLSRGRKLTIRNDDLIARGIHPITRVPTIDTGATCKTCVHHFANRFRVKTYHKCALNCTGGPGTDLRVGWPACTRYEANE